MEERGTNGPPWLPVRRPAAAAPALPEPPSPPPPGPPPPEEHRRPQFNWRRFTRSPRGAAGVATLAAALLLWPFAGLSWIPWLIGLGALVVLRVLRLDGPLRGWDLPLAGLAVVIGLMMSTGPWAWALAASIGVLLAGLAQLPWWRLAAAGAVLCLFSGIGYGISAYQARLDFEQAQARAGDLSRAGIAERSEEILPAFVRALEQSRPDPQPICRLLGGQAEGQLVAATGRSTCPEAVAIMHTRLAASSASFSDDLPAPRPDGPTAMLVDACSTQWAVAAGPELGRIHLQQANESQRTYEVESFSPC